MAWITLTEAQLETRLAKSELDAYKSTALADGLTAENLLLEVLQGVVREVRGRVAACDQNNLGPGDTIPDELEHHALAIAVYRLITRLPISGRVSLLEQRKSAYDDAMRVLGDVATCKFAVVAPETETTEVVSRGTAQYTTYVSNWSRDAQDGL